MRPTTAAVVGFAVTLGACPLVFQAIRHRLLDEPNHRSSHDQPTPRGGGLAVAIGALAAIAFAGGLSPWRSALVLTAAAFGTLGLLDDLRTLPALTRLTGQFVVGLAALPLLLRGVTGPMPWRVVFSVGVLLWLVSYVNAFNFMDGINGISSAQAIVAGTAWFLIGRNQGIPALEAGGIVVAACAAAFTPFNYPRALMFLGDVGSYFLGGWIAVLVVVGLRSGLPFEAVLAPVAVALADTMSTIVRRVRRGETWHAAHREHIYQQLVRAGWSHTVTTAFVALTATGCSVAGAITIAADAPLARALSLAVIAIILAGYLRSPALLEGVRRGRRALA